MALARVGELVNARGTALGADPGFGFKPALAKHALESRIEGPFFNLQQIVGNLLEMLYQRVAVHWLQAKRLQDHDFECAREKIAVFGIFSHGRIVPQNSYF